MNQDPLAWSKHPEPKGSLYAAAALKEKNVVTHLFEASKDNNAYINADGWQYLFNYWGFKGLFEIDKTAQWLDTANEGEWISRLVYFSLMAGYHPLLQQKGDYDPDSGKFIGLQGRVSLLDWEAIHAMRLGDMER